MWIYRSSLRSIIMFSSKTRRITELYGTLVSINSCGVIIAELNFDGLKAVHVHLQKGNNIMHT